MSAPNINQITSQFARMSDQQIQQYAAMHKNDPYTMSLALSEMNRRKETRSAQMGQQQQQPKVVDQAIAGMSQGLPEDSGIAQLPTGPMQYADGGIVAFAEAGQVTDEQQRISDQEGIAKFGRDVWRQMQNAGTAILDVGTMPIRGLAGAYDSAVVRPLRALGANIGYTSPLFMPSGADPGSQTPFYDTMVRGKESQIASPSPNAPAVSTIYPDMESRRVSNTDAPTTAAPALTAPPKTQAPGINTSLSAAPRPSAAPAPAGDFMSQLEAIREKQGMAVDKTAKRREEINASEAANNQATVDEIAADQAARGIAGKGQDERLAKREAGIAADAKSNEAFSFINAGLAMMQSRGRGLAGIAEGAAVGTKQYGEGIAKLRLAQEKADEARDTLENLRRNEATMDSRETRIAKKDARNSAIQGQKFMLEGVMQAENLNRVDATAAITANRQAQESALDRDNRLKTAAIAAGPGNERNKMLAEAQGSEAKLRAEYGKLQTKVMAELSKDMTYVTATSAEKDAMQTRSLRAALMNNPFLSSYASNVGFATAPAGPVRTLDGSD